MAQILQVAQRTYANYERDERLPDAAALQRLVAEGWNANWILSGEGAERIEDLAKVAEGRAGYASQDLDEASLTIAIEFADEAIGPGWLPRTLYARLVKLLYQGVMQGLPVAEVHQIAASTAKAMAQGTTAEDANRGAVIPGSGHPGEDPAGKTGPGKR